MVVTPDEFTAATHAMPEATTPCTCSDIQPWAVYAAMGVGVAIGVGAFVILTRKVTPRA